MRGCAACGESNPARARFCLGCGHPLDDQPEAAPELRRSISIIFADLVGSTVLGESLDAEALRYVTGRYFDAMCAAVERHEGRVEKFIGDAVVALFGCHASGKRRAPGGSRRGRHAGRTDDAQ